MRLRSTPMVLALLTAGLAPSAAQALPLPPLVEQGTAAAGRAVARDCETRLPAGAPGAQVTPYVAPVTGAITVRTAGGDGDWDLAVFDAGTGRRLAASSAFGARETATAYAERGTRLSIQACRRSGTMARLPFSVSAVAADPAAAAKAVPARLVAVSVGGPRDVAELEGLGLDVSHEARGHTVDVVLYSARERARLRAAGFRYFTRVKDLGAADRRARTAETSGARAAVAPPLPSGRTTYRVLSDFQADLKALADGNPGLVRPVTLPVPSLEGRPIEGVEIAADVGRVGDGRPIFLLSGDTHAREWPSGEVSMEYAIDLAKRYAARDPRVRGLLARVRVIVLPVLNPDGFVVSRTAGAAQSGGDDSPSSATLGQAATDSAAYKRKNCRAATEAQQATPCASRTGFGVDLNRAYGAYWGGPGTSNDPTTQQYRGPAPFSEPEAMAVRAFGAAHQVQTFITNHTYTDVGRFLRQPGFKIPNDEVGDTVPDEPIFKGLGDAMAAATGYVSELGYATLGNITGPSDDFLYYSQGTIGYTPELRGNNFHTNYASAVVQEFDGDTGHAGKGLREAFTLAAEQAADPGDHAVVTGSAPAGRVLRLKKVEPLHTSDDEDGDGTKDKAAIVFDETLDTTLTVPASGIYEWHVNPSTRPLAPAKEAFTFTCETADGTVLERHDVVVDRNQIATQDFACDPAMPPAGDAVVVTRPPDPADPGTPGGTPPGGQGGPGGPGPSAQRVRVLVRRPSISARRLARKRRVSVYLQLSGGGLRSVRVRIVARGDRTVASGTRAVLPASGTIGLRLLRRPRPGLHTVVVTGRDASGRAVRATRRVRLKR